MDLGWPLMPFVRLRMRKICVRLLPLVACGFLALFTGCGGGDSSSDMSNNNSGGSTNNLPPPPTGGDLAPASIGDNTIHGTFISPHDHTTQLHFRFTTVGDSSGSYTYEEENLTPNSGTYTWTKTAPNVAVLDTSNNGSLTFTYTANQSGTYEYARPGYDEQGTFTTDN